MPFEWVEPATFVFYKDVPIYNVYYDDDMVSVDYYTTNMYHDNGDGDDGGCQFSVQHLQAYLVAQGHYMPWENNFDVYRTIMHKAIDLGILKDGEPVPEEIR